MAVIGMTGSGKSLLTSYLLDRTRDHFVVLKSKADSVKYPDRRVARPRHPQAPIVTRAATMADVRQSRLVLRPTFERQREEFLAALQHCWKDTNWTVAVDELYYVDTELGLKQPINRLLTQGREPGNISVVCGMQRPSIVTRFAIGEATHVITFAVEGRDAKILRDATSARVADAGVELPRHHFVWYHVPTRSVWVGKLDLGTGKLVGRNL